MERRRENSSARPGRSAARKRGDSRARDPHSLDEIIRKTLRDGDAILIVPPFATLRYPSLAVHLLQACCRRAGFRVSVLYANFLLAAVLGEDDYTRICEAPMGSFAAERFFARVAFGVPRLGRRARRKLLKHNRPETMAINSKFVFRF